MSYYENRIKELEHRIEQMARADRLKAIPVEAQLIERIAELNKENARLKADAQLVVKHLGETCADNLRLKSEVDRLRKAGDELAENLLEGCNHKHDMSALNWYNAKEGKPTK